MTTAILRTPDAARYVGLAAQTLHKFRIFGGGPVFVRLGKRAVGYEVAALDEWIASRRRRSTSDPSEGAAP